MKYLLNILLVLIPLNVFANAPNGVDIAEITRRGNMVEHITNDEQHAEDIIPNSIAQVMQMPEDDSGKWFISVVGTKDCTACDLLKSDWLRDGFLQSIAIPGNGRDSWAHLTYFNYEDQSQSWRWRNIEFRGFPTVIIQPPRNEEFGPVKDIVFLQAGYSGEPEVLARKMIDAIKLRISKFPPSTPIRGPPQDDLIGVDPPWEVDPQSDPRPIRPFRVPDTPPAEAPVSFPTWSIPGLLVGGPLMWLSIGGLVFWAFVKVREWRIEQGKKPVIDDSTMEFLVNLAKQFDIIQDDEEVEVEPVITKKRVVRRKRK